MGGFFGAVKKDDAIYDVFFGTDYHSHLGTKRGGMAAFDEKIGLQRDIHNIENSPFRTKFDGIFDEMQGKASIGCISDTDPQPLLISSSVGTYAICIVGRVTNKEEIVEISRKIDTFETSILPYEDCCTVFTPKHPATKPRIEKVIASQNFLDWEKLIDEAVEGTVFAE